jgi:dienelactone hydrolase
VDSIYQNNTFKTLVFLSFFFFNSCAFVGQLVIPMESIDKPKGSYGIGTQVFFWTDATRSEQYTTDPTDLRNLLVQIWYPAKMKDGYQKTTHMVFPERTLASMAETLNAPANFIKHGTRLMSNAVQGAHPLEGEVFPLILFSHGDGGVATQNLSQIEALVSRGYVVIAPNHTYNASITFDKDGIPTTYKSNITWREQALHNKKYYANQLIRYRYEDMAFLLDEISKRELQGSVANPYYTMIDFDRVGMMGHSMGAGTSYHALINDTRIKSVVALDGWFFPLDQKTFSTKTNKPFLHLGQEEFLDLSVGGDINDSQTGKINFEIHNTILDNNTSSFVVYVKNSLHQDFTDFKQIYIQDRPFTFPIAGFGDVSKSKIKNIMNKSIVEFFDHTLKAEAFDINVLDRYKKNIEFKYDISE